MDNAFASALIACFRYRKLHGYSVGARRLFDAVNEAFVHSAIERATRHYGAPANAS